MTYYEKLSIGKHLGHEIVVGVEDGKYYIGTLTDGLINEDWEEDEEKEALGLKIEEKIVCIELDTIKFLTRASNMNYIEKVS